MKHVLNVGQCALDHSNISDLLKQHFDVEIDRAGTHDEAVSMVERKTYDLILINRLYDSDGSAGQTTVEQLCNGQPECPVMLVSNFEDAQQAAIEVGATRGFGKAGLSHSQTLDALKSILA